MIKNINIRINCEKELDQKNQLQKKEKYEEGVTNESDCEI